LILGIHIHTSRDIEKELVGKCNFLFFGFLFSLVLVARVNRMPSVIHCNDEGDEGDDIDGSEPKKKESRMRGRRADV
jgi:hypothetical protein